MSDRFMDRRGFFVYRKALFYTNNNQSEINNNNLNSGLHNNDIKDLNMILEACIKTGECEAPVDGEVEVGLTRALVQK